MNLSDRAPTAGFLLALLLAPCANAGDWHVDPRRGDDANGDGSAQAPWRSITHALQSATGPDDRLVLAKGQFSKRNGERFPLLVPTGVSILGAGRDATAIVCDDAVDVVHLEGTVGGAWNFGPSLAHLTVRGGSTGVRLLSGAGPQVLVVDVTVEGAATGAALSSAAGGTGTGGSGQLRILRALVRDCATGVLLTSGSSHHPSLWLEDSRVLDCTIGALTQADGQGGSAALHIARTRIEDCDLGVLASGAAPAFAAAYMVDSFVVDCARSIDAVDRATANLAGVTLAGAGTGLAAVGPNPDQTSFWCENTILWCDPATTLPAAGLLFVRFTDAPVLLPGEGNVSVDPGFVRPERGDYDLRPDSPLIDAGGAGVVAFGVDTGLDPRLLDGDGSGIPDPDIGADEYNSVHLDLIGVLVPGGPLTPHVTAPPGWQSEVYLSLGKNDSVLSATAGNWLLEMQTLLCLTCGVGPGATFPVPALPELSGLELYLQAYAWDPTSSAARASNRVDLILP